MALNIQLETHREQGANHPEHSRGDAKPHQRVDMSSIQPKDIPRRKISKSKQQPKSQPICSKLPGDGGALTFPHLQEGLAGIQRRSPRHFCQVMSRRRAARGRGTWS